jgi:FkbM family methyltransferase
MSDPASAVKQPAVRFFSQLGQDRFVFENFFRGRRDGVFVDVGAYDGEKFSNTLFFERYLGWSGVCIEPLPDAYAKLAATRTARCFNCCVSDYEGTAQFLDVDVHDDERMLSGLVENYDARHSARIDLVAKHKALRQSLVTTLPALLRECDLKKIDYCSIDTEGSELKILESIDFGEFDISVLSIENNYDDERIRRLMKSAGYRLMGVFEGYDELYAKKDVEWLPQTTVICAAWHGDPERHRRLEAHSRNLRAQTHPVSSIYVFDNADAVPPGLDGRAIVAHEKLTVYEAWNVALAAVRTPFVMNLNLDDRLAPDAIVRLEMALYNGADLAAGDWRICYSAEEADDVAKVFPAGDLPFVSDWPPRAGTRTRLGSGTAERGTFGPACIWRMALHAELGRYPWRFGDETPVRTIGDAIWWEMLKRTGKKLVRLPFVVGNYLSQPASQAEFRHDAEGEAERLKQVGINNQ